MDLTGKIIVSMPSLEDERFFKTVIYMCAHSSEGSMGIIINKNIKIIAGPRKINCLKNALESSTDLLSATLKREIKPKHKILNTMNSKL